MNQILNPESGENLKVSNVSEKKKVFSKMYRIQFIISLLIACLFLGMFFIRIFKIHENERIAEELIGIYHVSTLYSENTDYVAQSINNTSSNFSTPFVIGMIKINKIGLNYPILSQSNKELLDVSLCRFAGPLPNEPRKSLHCGA